MPSPSAAGEPPLADRLLSELGLIPVLPRALLLDTPGVRATVPMLRGVWGAALHDLDPDVYGSVFHRQGGGEGQGQVPAYVLRPAPPDAEFAPAVEWVLIGRAAIERDGTLLLAWGMAMQRGLGKDRVPFFIRRCAGLEPGGRLTDRPRPWTLGDVVWPLSGDPGSTPCRLTFHAPLRLLRKGCLIPSPTLHDIVVRGVKRIAAFLPDELQEGWHALRGEAIELARQLRTRPWHGQRLDLKHYSSSQDREIDMHGVCGHLDLPEGPGALWPLLASLQWLHVGKVTVMGLGQLGIEPLGD